jgi:hypothetical protein
MLSAPACTSTKACTQQPSCLLSTPSWQQLAIEHGKKPPTKNKTTALRILYIQSATSSRALNNERKLHSNKHIINRQSISGRNNNLNAVSIAMSVRKKRTIHGV